MKIFELKPGWLLYYIIETYHLNRFRENIKSISGKFGQDFDDVI